MHRRSFLGLLTTGTVGCALRLSVDGPSHRAQEVFPVADATWLARLPKIELHIHLEGAIPKPTLWELIDKYGGEQSIRTPEDLDDALAIRDLKHFFRMWVWMIGFLREYEDFTLIARAVAQDLARQNIRYVEAFFSPPDFRRSRLIPQRVVEAIRKGLDDVPSIEVALIADLVRERGSDHARELLERVAEVREHGVIGIGIGGWEPAFPAKLFGAVYERAHQLDFFTTAHAGEFAGASSVWDAIRVLRVDRIGHATRAIEDPELVQYLADHRIPLELCPHSNVRTGIINSVREHPVRQYFDLGIPISLNTDDPLFFGNSLVDEFVAVRRFHRFSRENIKHLIVSSIESSWLPADRKTRLAETFRNEPGWNETDQPRSMANNLSPLTAAVCT
jgi:adenosine deaminase